MWAAQGHCGTSDTALWESMMKCHVSTYTLFVSMRGQSAHKTPKAHYGSTFCILALFLHTVSVPVSHPEREADWHECLKLNTLWHTLSVHRISRIADNNTNTAPIPGPDQSFESIKPLKVNLSVLPIFLKWNKKPLNLIPHSTKWKICCSSPGANKQPVIDTSQKLCKIK